MFEKYITILEQNKLKLYNSVGREETALDIEISTPIFEANGDYSPILADMTIRAGLPEENAQ